jgi:hypothetical protein
MRTPLLLLVSCCGLVGCSAATADPQAPSPGGSHSETRPSAPGTRGTTNLETAPAEVRRVELGSGTSVQLPYRLVAIDGSDRVLAIADEPAAHLSHLRTLDGSRDPGPLVTLARRHVAAAIATPDLRVVTSDGRTLRVESLDGAPAAHPLELRAAAVVALGKSRVAFLEEREESPASSATVAPDPPKAAKAPQPMAPRPAPKPRRTSIKRTKPAKVGTPHPAPPPPSKPTPVRLWLHVVGTGGALEPEIDTRIAFPRPMPGMGLVGAVGSRRGAHALWYQPSPSQRHHGRLVPFAELAGAELGIDGKLLDSARPLVGGPRQFGFLDGHLRPRLFPSGEASLYVGRHEVPLGRGTKRVFEAFVLGRDGELQAPDSVWVTDPTRALLAPSPSGNELARLESVAAANPHLAEPQSSEEPGRVAWAGEDGFFLTNGRLMHASRTTGTLDERPSPFVAHRRELRWSAVAPDGSALAAVGETLFTVATDGTTHERALPDENLAVIRPSSLARIGGTWWGLVSGPIDAAHPGGNRVVRLEDGLEHAALSRVVFQGSSVLVGGDPKGVALRIDGRDLVIEELGTDGVSVVRGRWPSPVRPGFSAVPRAGGGALVVGVEAGAEGRAVAFRIEASGHLGPVERVELRIAPGLVALMPLPAGGAVAWAAADPREPWTTPAAALWLDDEGHPAAHAAWPESSDDEARACSAGWPLPSHLPSPEPGHFVPLAVRDACVTTLPAWTVAGLRGFATRDRGLDRMAERIDISLASALLAARPNAPGGPTASPVVAAPAAPPRCPADMVLVANELCIDRFESQLVDGRGAVLSPYHSTQPAVAKQVLDEWTFGRLLVGDLHARAMPLPPLLRSVEMPVVPVATSRPGVIPTGYLSGVVAEAACRSAGKRLCSADEWTRACRGETDSDFPYGDEHEQGACNVNRYAHPAATLHGNAAIGHLDPRLNLVKDGRETMLRPTGATPRCVSRWGNDGVHDMVGNLDEWLDDEDGAFAGGFYARATRKGCGAVITVHPRRYFDYSLGTRCCLTP